MDIDVEETGTAVFSPAAGEEGHGFDSEAVSTTISLATSTHTFSGWWDTQNHCFFRQRRGTSCHLLAYGKRD